MAVNLPLAQGMHRVCIIQGRDLNVYDDYDYTIKKLTQNVTDFADISHDDFVKLQMASTMHNFTVIEIKPDPVEFIQKTVADYTKYVADLEAKRIAAEEEARAKRLRKKAEKQARAEAKTLEQKKALLETLQEEIKVEEAKTQGEKNDTAGTNQS